MIEEKNKGGRPTDYSPEMVAEICRLISSRPMGLRTICRENQHIPCHTTIYEWLAIHKEFADKYAVAKILQANILVDEMLDIADDSSKDVVVGENGEERLNTEFYQRGRLRIDTRKFLASKLMPKIYGDRLQTEITGADGGPIAYAELTEDERKQRAAELFDKARARRAAASGGDGGEGEEAVEAAAGSADQSA